MGVLQFDGIDDFVEWTTLSGTLQSLSAGAVTYVVVCRTAASGVAMSPFAMLTSTPSFTHYVSRDNSNLHSFTASQMTTAWPGSAIYAIVASKASGSATPTWFTKNVGTNTVVANHTSSANPVSGTSSTQIEVGRLLTGEFWSGHIGVIAAFNYAMTNTQKEECLANYKTSDLANHSGGPPLFLSELITSSPTDLMENASGFSNNGPTVDTGTTFSPWTFDALGNVDPPQILRPDADTAVTGWTTAPVFSKVNDNADGTVVTGALS